jgi:hypothetical protein
VERTKKRFAARAEIITLPGKRPYRCTHLWAVKDLVTGLQVVTGATTRASAETMAAQLNATGWVPEGETK